MKARTFSHLFFILWYVSVTLLNACQKEEMASRDYPRLKTLDVIVANDSVVTFNAEIISGNLQEITEYGFVWGTTYTPQIEFQDKYTIAGPATSRQFRQTVNIPMADDKTYYVRAFLKTPGYLVYGKTVSINEVP